MAESEVLAPIEETEAIPDEDDYIEKLRAHFKEKLNIVHDFDLLRVVRGYATEKNRWEDTVEHLQLWIDALKKDDFANIGFKPMPDQEMYKNLQEWAQFTVHGEDKFGHPIMYENTAKYNCEEITANLEQSLIYRRRVFSQMWNKKHQTSTKTGKMIYKQINVFNLENIGVMSANKFKNVVQKMIAAEGDLFPESVYKMYFINTGFWFKAAWAVISMFVHPKTKEKIQMLGTSYIEKMQDDIPLDQIPKQFGGTSKAAVRWGETYFDEPVVAQFPQSGDAAEKDGEIVEKADSKKPVQNEPAAVEEKDETSKPE